MNMKFKNLALVLAIVLMAGTLTPAFASPFADVPADHWAYDAIVELAAAGLIEGYPDGTYGGSRMMTRYEAAMVFARALQRLETQIAAIDLLPELDKIKAELMAEIEAALAEAGPAETTVIERVIVDKDVDEETLARIRANEVALEALEGDMAYLEARFLGLLDGIRYDLNQLKDQEIEVEVPSMEEIEALIAAKIEESLVDVAAAVKEPAVIERVVTTTPEMSKEDVEFIAEALIYRQVQKFEGLFQENRDLIAGLTDWVADLDTDVAVLKDDVADLKTTVADLEKVRFSGKLSLEAEKEVGETELTFAQEGNLTLNVKASEATTVKANIGWELDPFNSWALDLADYNVEVTSTTPLNSLLVGKVAKGKLSPFGYVLPAADYNFGGLAKVKFMDDLTLDLFAGGDSAEVDVAATLQYTFVPELGLKLKGATTKPAGAEFTNNAAAVGIFGEVAGIEYTGDFAMDFSSNEKNYLGVATLNTEVGPLTLDGKFVYQEENYKVANQLINAANRFAVEGGLKTEFAGLNLAGRAYYEGAPETVATAEAITAFKLNADTTFDLFVPVTLSGQFVGNKTGDDEMVTHALAKLEIAQDADYGLRYGVSAAYENNVLGATKNANNWKNVANISETDEARFGANVGYGLDLSGAKLDLDYEAKLVLPIEPEGDMTLTHNVDLGYAFTKDVTLSLGGTVKHGLADPISPEFGYSAGLSVSF